MLLLTHNHYVLTAHDWIPIDEIQLGETLIGVKNNLLVPSKVLTLSHLDYTGIVRSYNDDLLIGKNIKLDAWSRNPIELEEPLRYNFTGELFSIITSTNNVIVRYGNTQDYTLLLCQTVE
jgi:hypothetical protein